jgi:glycosyltransferase involved in cell wall biosynthesis
MLPELKLISKQPLISIITVVFNCEQHLEATILSVLNQTDCNYEYIIVDGGSTDGTIAIIKKYRDRLSYWISESDRGIYDAMNKGIKLAQGKIIGILNAGDLYCQDTLKKVAELYTRNQQYKYLIITGSMTRFDTKTQIKFTQQRKPIDLKRRINLGMPLNHPATFVTKNVYETIGYFNSKFKISGDYDFIFRAYHSQLVKFIFTESILASMSMGGRSEQLSGLSIRAREGLRIRRKKLSIIHNILLSSRIILIGYIKHLLLAIAGQKAVLIQHQIKQKTFTIINKFSQKYEDISY